MQASLCLRAPQLSLTLHRQRSTLQCHFGYEKYFVALRRQTNSSYRALRATVRTQTPSSDPAPPSHESRTLAAVARAAVVTVALASAMACICPSWIGRGRIGLAAPWHNINITNGAERDRQEGKRDIKRKKLKSQIAMRQRTAADQVLDEMFERKDLPAKFYKITPNYPKIKEYFEDHLRLSDEACETLIRSWKKIKPGPDQIEIGLLLVDLCIIKGNVAEANEIDKEIIKNAPEMDQRPVIRRVSSAFIEFTQFSVCVLFIPIHFYCTTESF
ncbi:hypothetical protein MA16_Dca021093 [Dendrobium catenatum]|uniref:Uncharacterized protein n=1 Tax=Dendrobium catenatum TaxID=906689 RepID=A0A2I0VXX4_9ASPA|nr:hypothetical protein MA16_Dca021093 [Dendrobium catenatum]